MIGPDASTSADTLVDELIVDATRMAFESIDRPEPVTITAAVDLLHLLALCELRLVGDPRGLTRRAIRRIEHERGLL